MNDHFWKWIIRSFRNQQLNNYQNNWILLSGFFVIEGCMELVLCRAVPLFHYYLTITSAR